MAIGEKTDSPAAEGIEHQETVGGDVVTHEMKIGAEAAAQGQGTTGYESLSIWQTAKKFKMNALICFLVTFSAATDGYQIALIGNIIANAGFVKKFGTETNANGETVLASSVMSAWNSIGSVGQIVGMTTLPFLSDRFGRKVAMFWYWFLLALSVMVESVASDWRSWLVAKLIGGIGVGCLQSTIPTYVSEVSPVRIRGAFLMCYSLWWLIGQFFAPIALQVMSTYDPDNYLTPVYTQWSQIGLMLIIYLFVPESPAWCATKGRETQAKKILRTLYKGVTDFDVDHQYQLLVMNIEHERELAVQQRTEKWYAIFKGTDGLRTVVSLWTLLAQQFIGLGVFLSFGSYFFQQAGIEDPFKVTCITSGINIFFSFVVIYLAEATGRRWLACSGTTLCWLCNIAVGILGVVSKGKVTNNLLILFACLWNVGLVANGATGWGFIGEISAQRLRPYTAGFAAASTCVVGVVMGVLIPYMVNANQWNWGLKTCWFFAGVGLPFTIAIWFLIPETAGRSAAELDELFERKVKPWRFHKETTMTQRLVEAKAEA
ncbi:general substrate transporter [Aspergillus pseudoustus]|uniref:General substrate transporter n=1 Tax=Aspergillus pseudoustus TaxID=1810923 RepID=A0ABR4ITF1_9EURO